MISSEQAEKLSGARKTIALTRQFQAKQDEDYSLRYAQVGIPFSSEYAAYLVIHLKSPDSLNLAQFQELAADLHENARKDGFKWVAVIGVSFDQWREWAHKVGSPPHSELFDHEDALRDILTKNQPPYALDGGDLLIQIKSCDQRKPLVVAEKILTQLQGVFDESKTNCSLGDSLPEGRIYGGRMLHGLISSVEPVGFSARAIIGDEFPRHKGASICLTQRFVHDWQQLLGMADSELENLIGRDHRGNIVLSDDERAHIKLVRVNDEYGVNYRLVGQSLPFRKLIKLTREENDGYRLDIEAPSSQTMRIGPGKETGIYQVSFAKSALAFARVLDNMIGTEKGYIKSRHLNVSHADMGNYWYIPSVSELDLPAPHTSLTVAMNEFFSIRSNNNRMFYNTKDYLYRIGNRDIELDPPLTDRVIELLGYTFSRWHDTWYRRRLTPELGHLESYLNGDDQNILEIDILDASVAERKGFAVKRTLELLSSKEPGIGFDTYRIHPRELIVGVVPRYTLGSGFEVMRYLNEEEAQNAFLDNLGEGSAAGHNTPDYHRILKKGIGGLIDEVKQRLDGAEELTIKQFYQSVVYALEGVRSYLYNYATLARELLSNLHHESPEDRANLENIAARMEKIAVEPPGNFIEAAQLIFSMHCCMHIAGEAVSIGRLDQYLMPFYENDDLDPGVAQEIIDCFWIKMDEQVLLNHRHFNDQFMRGSIAITYAGADFPQGAAINQWVQQVTVGGYKTNNDDTPEDGSNEVTRMCLRAARRLPLNAPCLSLKLSANTPDDLIEETAKCILSGGAHPLLINDDKIIAGLLRSGEGVRDNGNMVELADARDMTCDGCFESLIAGKCEFAFAYVSVPDAIEMALNRGRTYAAAGPVHITGLKASYRSPAADEIKTWDDFYDIFLTHYRLKLVDFYAGMLGRYGKIHAACPSPLLSAFIDGCLESGRDLSAGGAKYKLLAPLMNGITTAIDSLWAIRHMVFSEEAVFTLPTLLKCLICDWGHDMKEPFYSAAIGTDRIASEAKRFRNLRAYALALPKFGQDHDDINHFGRMVVRDIVDLAYDTIRKPEGRIAELLDGLRSSYGTLENPFEFVITPGIATFEDYAGVGSFLGASADGRRNRQPVESDFSPTPWPSDLPVNHRSRPVVASLGAWAADKFLDDDPIGVGLSNGSPVDINIREDFPIDRLEQLIRTFASGEIGSNMLTISCADPDTLVQAQQFPERYDLIRLRMGGWSEFFVAMFPHHQEHHKRRPIFEATGPT